MEGYLFYDTLLEYYLGIDYSNVPDSVWAWKIRHLIDIREQEAKGNKQ